MEDLNGSPSLRKSAHWVLIRALKDQNLEAVRRALPDWVRADRQAALPADEPLLLALSEFPAFVRVDGSVCAHQVLDVLLDAGMVPDSGDPLKQVLVHLQRPESVGLRLARAGAKDLVDLGHLMAQVLEREWTSVALALIEQGVPLAPDGSPSALHWAARFVRNRPEVVDALIAQGADLELRSPRREYDHGTPLAWAARALNLPAFQRLLAHGADPHEARAEGASIAVVAAGAIDHDARAFGTNTRDGLALLELLLDLGWTLDEGPGSVRACLNPERWHANVRTLGLETLARWDAQRLERGLHATAPRRGTATPRL